MGILLCEIKKSCKGLVSVSQSQCPWKGLWGHTSQWLELKSYVLFVFTLHFSNKPDVTPWSNEVDVSCSFGLF